MIESSEPSYFERIKSTLMGAGKPKPKPKPILKPKPKPIGIPPDTATPPDNLGVRGSLRLKTLRG